MLSPQEWSIVALSLKVGGAAVLATLPLAFALAWALARYRFPGRVLLDGLVHLPLVLPPVVTGWLLLLAFGPRSEEHTSELQSLMRSSYAVFCLKKKNTTETRADWQPART